MKCAWSKYPSSAASLARPFEASVSSRSVAAWFAHKHQADEEVYVVLAGSGEALVDGETVRLVPMTALRCAATAVRSFAAGDDGLELLAFGAHTEGDGEVLGDPWS